jgi:hypothetical protein
VERIRLPLDVELRHLHVDHLHVDLGRVGDRSERGEGFLALPAFVVVDPPNASTYASRWAASTK